METPRVDIKLEKITENASRVNQECRRRGIQLTGVVKGAAGDLKVARAFLEGGITSLGDSRLLNLQRLRRAGFEEELLLLRLPQLNEVDAVVSWADISLVSEAITIQALGQATQKQGKEHGIIIMVDVGDLREGVLPEELPAFCKSILGMEGILLRGIGTNVGCYGGVLPSRENTQLLLELKKELERDLSLELELISGGNTATTILLENNTLPEGINHLRVGEAILQGTDITNQRVIPWLNQNNFILVASVIEVKEKPSVPQGEIGCDAFGNKPSFQDKGIRQRAILAVGRQDIKLDGLTPLEAGVEILGASSDHLLVDITEVAREIQVGDEMRFSLDYGAMLAAMTSPYIHKNYLAG